MCRTSSVYHWFVANIECRKFYGVIFILCVASWSYGVLLWEIFSMGGNSYPSVPVENLFELLRDGHRMERPPHATNDVLVLSLAVLVLQVIACSMCCSLLDQC